MKRYLFLDVGVTTGYAVLGGAPNTDSKWTLEEHGTFTEDSIVQALRTLYPEYLISHAVAERPVIVRGKLGDTLQRIMERINHEIPRALTWVDPAQWKSSPQAKTTLPRGLTTHERDAIRLGVWWLISGQGSTTMQR